MEWAAFIYNAGVGVGVVLIGLAALVLAFAAIPLLREGRRLASDARRLVALVDGELRPTLAELRAAARDLGPRLERLDEVIENADATLTSVRAASETVARYAGAPGAGVASVAASLRRARDVFSRGRSASAPVESSAHREDPGT